MIDTLPQLFGRTVTAVHCAGVGGMGLGPLAIYLAQRGFRVSGEDDGMVEAMQSQLVRAGVTITAPGEIPADCQLVVFSSAISPRHPARVTAQARGLPMVRRGELLAEVTRDCKLVAVCGSHVASSFLLLDVCLSTVLRDHQILAHSVTKHLGITSNHRLAL